MPPQADLQRILDKTDKALLREKGRREREKKERNQLNVSRPCDGKLCVYRHLKTDSRSWREKRVDRETIRVGKRVRAHARERENKREREVNSHHHYHHLCDINN